MRKLKFTKMVGSGNDFIVISAEPSGNLSRLAKVMCDRKYGIGADGVLLLEKSKKADLSMRIFNADGSEAQMCGNGARCAALFYGRAKSMIQTCAGLINAEVSGAKVKIQLTDPKAIKLDIPLALNGRKIKVNFINTGVPHAVVFVNGIEGIALSQIGRAVRNHRQFSPAGTNVDFVEVKGKDLIRVRTYERGVEDETLACGTGSSASALIFALKSGANNLVKVATQSGETLKIYFQKEDSQFSNVWLEGSARIVCKGEYYV
jgi:diaminopimelate epimerase